MVKAVAEVCLAFKHRQPPRWLSLLGKAGVGKTHCAHRVFSWMANRCDWSRCEYVHHPVYWPRMISDLRSGDGRDQIRDMTEWPVLMLDDIGAERDTTGFAAEQLNALLGQRVGKWTIITSNLMLEQLGAIDPRIADRIIREPGNQFVALDTLSFGLRKRESSRLPYAD